MWHVLDAAPNARVFAGFRPGTGRRELEDAIRNARFEEVLQSVPVAAGDTIFVPGGRVHALDAGLLILEVQQNSNTTYRLYDWGRVGHDGRPRDTHLAQAMRVIDWQDGGAAKADPSPLPSTPPNARDLLVQCPYFRIERLQLRAGQVEPDDPGAFRVYFVVAGVVRLEWAGGNSRVSAGASFLIPAALRNLRILPEGGPASLVRASMP
jgi:mannose-6-phosphate isomerase